MTREEAFLADILEHPDEDGPRLVYADWLEDQGDADRAEFIRAQLELNLNAIGERFRFRQARPRLTTTLAARCWRRATRRRRWHVFGTP